MVLLDGRDVDEDGWGHAGAAGRDIYRSWIGIRWYYWSGKTGRDRTRSLVLLVGIEKDGHNGNARCG